MGEFKTLKFDFGDNIFNDVSFWNAQFCILHCKFCFLDLTKLVGIYPGFMRKLTTFFLHTV